MARPAFITANYQPTTEQNGRNIKPGKGGGENAGKGEGGRWEGQRDRRKGGREGREGREEVGRAGRKKKREGPKSLRAMGLFCYKGERARSRFIGGEVALNEGEGKKREIGRMRRNEKDKHHKNKVAQRT